MNSISLKEYVALIKRANTVLNFTDFDPASVFAHLLSAMYFPDSDEKRKLFFAKMHLLRTSKITSNTENNDPEYQHAAIGLAFSEASKLLGSQELLINSLLLQQSNPILSEITPRVTNGKLVGTILKMAIENKSAFEPTIKSVCQEISKIDYENTKKETRSKFNYVKNTLMKQFLPVSHFWAAYVDYEALGYLNFSASKMSLDEMFNNESFKENEKVNGIIGFLKYAEGYLMRGLHTIPVRTGTHKPLLDVEKMMVALLPVEYLT